MSTYPLYIFPGGLSTVPSPILQYRPMEMTTCCPAVERLRSPRRIAPANISWMRSSKSGSFRVDVPLWMIDFPPRMMLVAPLITALRDTLSTMSISAAPQGVEPYWTYSLFRSLPV
jgi:hypothetical protein